MYPRDPQPRRDAGSLGLHLPSLEARRLELPPRALLVLATDGVERTFLSSTMATVDPAALASEILSRFRKGGDDALVVVAARATRAPSQAIGHPQQTP